MVAMNRPGRPRGSRTNGTTARLRMRRVVATANRVLYHYCLEHMPGKVAEQYRFRDYLGEVEEVNAIDGIRALLGLNLADFERQMRAGTSVRQFVAMAKDAARKAATA